jgi:UDP-N-acetylglucosamine 2-epimerase (non-hydrolysing)
MKKKIIVILGTRPEIIRLSVVMKKIQKYFNLCVVNTGQNYNKKLNKFFFKELRLPIPKHSLKCNNESPIRFVSDLLPKIDEILKIEKPDAVLILGDTNSGLSALCAKRKKIPIFHLEAGNRCFDNRVPEEINRKIIDGLADVNLTYSEVAKQNLIKENFDLDKIIKVGSPLAEVFEYYHQEIETSKILLKLKLNRNNYFLVSCHREENVDSQENLKIIFSTLNSLSNKYKVKIIVSTHPRTKIRLK